MFSRQFSWTTVYFGPTGGQQEPWCAVGRFRWKRVFTWAGKVKLSFYLLLWICFHALRRLLYDLKSAISIVCLLQVEAIKKISEYVAQLRRVGQGHGRNQNKISFLINVTNLTFSPLLNMIINYLNCLLSSPSKRVVLWWGILGVWHFDQMLLHGEEVVAWWWTHLACHLTIPTKAWYLCCFCSLVLNLETFGHAISAETFTLCW